MNLIWLILIFIGFIFSIITNNFEQMSSIIIDSTKESFNTYLQMSLLILFWNGIFNIAIKSGLINYFSKIIIKPVRFIFKYIKEEETLNLICANIIANLLGIGSCSTSLGLKIMKKLENNKYKNINISTFLIINVCSISLFPLTILGIRNSFNTNTKFDFVILMITVTIFSNFIGLFINYLFWRKKNKC